MDPLALATARHHLYELLGRLVIEGPTAELLAIARALPALADALDGDVDELAAAHHAAFAHELSAHEGVILGEGLLGGRSAAECRELYAQAGFAPPTGVEPDHLGVQLRFLGGLCAAEAAGATGQAAGFLDAHLLRWLPMVSVALGPDGWGAVVSLALELAASHRASLPAARQPWALPDGSIDLESPDTGLRRIAAWLLRPARSGWLATSTTIGQVASRAGVPAGFGARSERLTSAWFAAADRGSLVALVGAIDAEIAGQHEALGAIAELGVDVGPWWDRQVDTREVLARIAARASSG